ncbi:hypothetical protein Q1695_006644 [Nippostrongylus brasiliensis]|nr:hypothetical protein Q1695_006644 [Nippostrongylus brasiliensis]
MAYQLWHQKRYVWVANVFVSVSVFPRTFTPNLHHQHEIDSLVFIEEITQPEAKRRCQEKGGQLATIHSKEENDLLYSLSKDPSVTTATYRAYIWIGLEKIDGKFQWLDGSPVDYTNWGPGEPNNYRGEESCTQFSQLTLSYGSMDPRGWNDYYCFEEIRGYACEKNVQP